MSEFKFMKFDEFVNTVYESEIVAGTVMERDKSVISGPNDNKLKMKQDDQKIKVVAATPKDPDEKIRYEFKVVTKNSDKLAAEQDAQNHMANLIADQVSKKIITADMVGFFKAEQPQNRAVGDFVVKGVISFYPASKFTGLEKIKELASYPVPVEEAVSPDLPITSNIVETEQPAKTVKVYRYEDMPQVLPADKKAGFDVSTVASVSSEIADPGGEQEKPQDQATTTTTTVVVPQNKPGTSYANLAKSFTVNQLVMDLQKKIIAKGTKDERAKPAADLILSKGGADGKFGDATGKAIALLLNKTDGQPIATIDQATSDSLNAILSDVTPEEIAKVAQPKPQQPAQQQPAQNTNKIKVKTPSGRDFVINEMRKFSYFNYARHIELLKFQNVNEGKVETLKSGANGGQYKKAWDTAVQQIGMALDMHEQNGIIEVQLVENDPKSMAKIGWAVQTDGSVTLTAQGEGALAPTQQTGTQQSSQSATVDPKYPELARLIIHSSSGYDTNETTMRSAFNLLKDQADFDNFSKYFASLKIPFSAWGTAGNLAPDMQSFKKNLLDNITTRKASDPNDCSLLTWVGKELDDDEILEVNSILQGKGIRANFKSL